MYINISELKGKTITKITNVDNEELYFECSDGSEYKMYHRQDCCEYVRLEDVVGELDSLLNSPLVRAEEVTNQDKNPDGVEAPEYQDSFTWTFYHFTTQRGDDVTLRWYGESNGYYSESVDFVKL